MQTLRIKIPEIPDILPTCTMACHAWGAPSSPALFCVHGLTRNGRDFDFVAQKLSKEFYVLCPDIAGRGQSDWLPTQYYNYPAYITAINQLLVQLKIEKLHWLGTSMGGILGMMMIAQPGLVESLILNDVGCLIPKEGLQRILGYAGVAMKFATRQEAELHVRNICAPFGIHDEMHWQHIFAHGIRQAKDGSCHLTYDPNIAAPLKTSEVNDVDLWPLWEVVKSIPVLLIRGNQSDILPESVAAQMAQNHPNLTRYDVANAGHAPALMANNQIDVIQQWLVS